MSYRTVHGVTKEQEVAPEWQARDIRSPLQKFFDWLREPNSAFILALVLIAGVWLAPQALPLVLPCLLGLVLLAGTSREEAPVKLPIQAGMDDPNEIDPATRRPSSAKGIFYLGNEMRGGKEIWLTNSDCRQHFLVLGTTGAGKTEALIGFGANALSWSSGFLFCDGKGDVALMAKVYAMLRRFGREDDLLVLNFMNDASSVRAGRINTNSINPFATGSADELTQMMVSLMDDVGGDGAMWKGRAVAMLTGVMRALVEKRDKGLLDLNVGEIRRHMVLNAIEELAKDRKNLSPSTIASIEAYLKSLPGYKENPGEKGQAQTTLDQHGYLQMQFTKILGSLTDVYGHIFSTPYGEVDIADVVLNRRVLVIMLPALKKSGDEINNLGKIVVANLKGMMGNVLGSTIDGRYEDIVDKRVTNAPSPFIVVLDEVGYYTVDGMAVMAAQARSLGFSLVFASQDIPAMKRRNEKEADSIIANTNVKIIMRLEDPGQTAKLAIDRGDKALRVRVGGFDRNVGDFSGTNYFENTNASFEETSRITLRDLAAQKDGEMHVLFQDKIIRARSFFANPEGAIEKSVLHPRPNHFVRVPRPRSDRYKRSAEMEALVKRITATTAENPRPGDHLARELRAVASGETDPVMAVLVGGFEGGKGSRVRGLQSAACVALARLAAKSEPGVQTSAQMPRPKDGATDAEPVPARPLEPVRAGEALPDKSGTAGRHRVVVQTPAGQVTAAGGVSEAVRDFAGRAAAATTNPAFPTDAERAEFARLLEEGEGVGSAEDALAAIDLGLLDELDRLGGDTAQTGLSTSAETHEQGPTPDDSAAFMERVDSTTEGRSTRAEMEIAAILFGEDDEEDEE